MGAREYAKTRKARPARLLAVAGVMLAAWSVPARARFGRGRQRQRCPGLEGGRRVGIVASPRCPRLRADQRRPQGTQLGQRRRLERQHLQHLARRRDDHVPGSQTHRPGRRLLAAGRLRESRRAAAWHVTTFTKYGARTFSVTYWNGSKWLSLGTVGNNAYVWRTVSFPPVVTTKVRVTVTLGRQERVDAADRGRSVDGRAAAAAAARTVTACSFAAATTRARRPTAPPRPAATRRSRVSARRPCRAARPCAANGASAPTAAPPTTARSRGANTRPATARILRGVVPCRRRTATT